MSKYTKKLKYNDSCVKLFEFIKMLYQDNVEFQTVINHFSDGNYDGTSNTHVTLNKYLNAMKIFGLKIKKHKGKYSILNPLSNLDFNPEDLRSIDILRNSVNMLPEGKNKKNFISFLHSLELRFDDTSKDIKEVLKTNKNLDFTFVHSDINEQISQCEKFCQDKLKLEIVYISNYGRERNIICSPLEVTFIKKMLCLKVLGNNGSRIYEIPFENIKSLRQLPIISSTTSVPTTVVYKISEGLARNYKLRDWEKIQDIKNDGSKVIVNKEEDFDLLIKRLMKYGKECQLISPKFLREEMIQLINKTLSKYN